MWFIYALCAAIVFGFRAIFYQWTSQRKVNSYLLFTGAYLTGILSSLIVGIILDQTWNLAAMTGIVIGFFSFIANSAYFKGFKVGKASLMALFSALPPVVVAIFAFFLWGETLNLWQFISFTMILAGILFIRFSSTGGIDSFKGIFWAILVMFGFSLTDTFTKQSTRLGADMFPTIFFMFLTGGLLFFIGWIYSLWKNKSESKQKKIIQKAANQVSAALENDLNLNDTDKLTDEAKPEPNETRWSNWRTLLWGMFIGSFNVGGVMLCLPAFALGVTSLVSIVIASNVLIVLLYVRFYLKEQFTRMEAAGITFMFLGIITLQLF